MAHYIFPTGNTEDENYFIQFDIYQLKAPLANLNAMTYSSDSSDSSESDEGESNEQRNAQQAASTATLSGLGAVTEYTKGVTLNVKEIVEKLPEMNNTYDYKQQASELLHSIKLPLQTSPIESTAGTYADESTRDFKTIANIFQGKAPSSAELQGLVQDETIKAIGAQLNRAQGKVLNQAQETLYGGPKKREYAFNFSLIARNFQDSKELTKIIRRLHYHAAPGHDNDKIFWSYPQMVRFLFLDKSGGRINLFSHTLDEQATSGKKEAMQHASKACFISSVTAEYGEQGDQLRFLDEQGNRTGVASVKLTVNLMEAEYFTKMDYAIDESALAT